MNRCVLGIRLKIPDNEAYTALTTLQRLSVPVRNVERMEVWDFEASAAFPELVEAVKKNETLFNANKHEVVPFSEALPRTGEVWIERLEERPNMRTLFAGRSMAGALSARRYTAWRLRDENAEPCTAAIVQMAIERLLCNPAIERAIT